MPVFLLQNNTGPNLRVPSARDMADLQIRKRLGDLVETCPACPLTKLHAISAFGTKISFYSVDISTSPRKIVSDMSSNTDTAPIGRWCYDVLEDEGAARLKSIVHEIHEACAQLDPSEHIFFWIFLTKLTHGQRSLIDSATPASLRFFRNPFFPRSYLKKTAKGQPPITQISTS